MSDPRAGDERPSDFDLLVDAGVVQSTIGSVADAKGDASVRAPARWSQTPNLVNLAANRAQRRLYVISDRRSWATHKYFHDLSSALR